MRILLVTPFFPPDRGGVPHHVATLVREYGKRGHRVAVLRKVADEGKEYALVREESGGFPLYSVRYRWRDATAFERTYRIPEVDERLGRVLDAERPDVVHAFHLTGLGIGLPDVARARGVPFVLTLSDFWVGCPRGQRIRPSLERCPTIDRANCLPCLRLLFGNLLPDGEPGRDALRRYDAAVREALLASSRLVSFSRFGKELYAKDGIPADRIEVVPLGIDPGPFRGLARSPSPALRIASLGTVMLTKGPHLLLDALRHLPKDRVSVRIHGGFSDWLEVKGYEARLRGSILPGDPVEFTGPYEPADVPRLLADADVLVVPSLWYETYSITIREGWLAGLPVVASRLGAMEEAIEDRVTGLLFRPGDARDLAARLQELLDDSALRRSLVASPKALPTAAETAERLLALYASLG